MDESAHTHSRQRDDAFWPRLRRASVLLIAAVAVHTWVIGTPGSTSFRTVPFWAEGVAGAKPVLASDGPEAPATAAPSKGVTVDVTIIEVPVVKPGPRHPTRKTLPTELPLRTVAAAGIAPDARAMRTPLAMAAAAEPAPSPVRGGLGDVGVVRVDRTDPPPDLPAARESRPATAETVLAAAPLPSLPVTPDDSVRLAARMAPPAEAAPASAPAREAPLDAAQSEALVHAVLMEYTRAYERMDVQAAKALWPSLDTRKLQKAFHDLEAQRVRLGNCRISMSGRAANAQCQADYAYTPRIGNRREQLQQREWSFHLAQADDRWQIVKASF